MRKKYPVKILLWRSLIVEKEERILLPKLILYTYTYSKKYIILTPGDQCLPSLDHESHQAR